MTGKFLGSSSIFGRPQHAIVRSFAAIMSISRSTSTFCSACGCLPTLGMVDPKIRVIRISSTFRVEQPFERQTRQMGDRQVFRKRPFADSVVSTKDRFSARCRMRTIGHNQP